MMMMMSHTVILSLLGRFFTAAGPRGLAGVRVVRLKISETGALEWPLAQDGHFRLVALSLPGQVPGTSSTPRPRAASTTSFTWGNPPRVSDKF